MQWVYPQVDQRLQNKLAQIFSLHPLIVKFLMQRDLNSEHQIYSRLFPSLKDFISPFQLTGLKFLASRFLKAIEQKERICIVGDYDVDGLTATALLVQVFRLFDLTISTYIPLREEGYGLNETLVEKLNQNLDQFDLLILVDCGTNAFLILDSFQKLGKTVLVIDHHSLLNDQWPCEFFLNPRVRTENQLGQEFCSAGLVFKVIHGLYILIKEQKKEIPQKPLKAFLDLTALGTLADLVPLTGDNATIIHFGLQQLQNSHWPGLQALLEISGIEKKITPEIVSFQLTPRLNASGRLSDAVISLDLLLSADPEKAHTLATKVHQLNEERKQIEAQIVQEAEQKIKDQKLYAWDTLLLHAPHWHSGIVGIVAGRLARKYQKPCLILGGESPFKGSGRCLQGSLIRVLDQCKHHLFHWGGHPEAIGISLEPKNWGNFRKAFEESFKTLKAQQALKIPAEKVTEAISLNTIFEPNFLDSLERIRSLGLGTPLFSIDPLKISDFRYIGKDLKSLQATLCQKPKPIRLIAWNEKDRALPKNRPFNGLVKITPQEWQGMVSVSLELVDWIEHANPIYSA